MTELLNRFGPTLEALIFAFGQYESLNARADDWHSKVKRTPTYGSADAIYAIEAAKCAETARKFLLAAHEIPGADAVRAICEAEWGEFTLERLKQIRGRVRLATGITTEDANRLPLIEVPRILGHANLVDRKPLLKVTDWSELAIGIDERWKYWAAIPAPQIGDLFPKAKSTELNLRGDRWKNLLKVFAEAASVTKVKRFELSKQLQGNLPAPNAPKDPRAMPGSIDSGIREELPAEMVPWQRQLNRDLGDLRRKLREHVEGPVAPNECLALEGEFVDSRFKVRFLIKTSDGSMTFGQSQ